MARVIAARVHLSAWILIAACAACAPSLPHPPETRAGPDAAIDQPSTIPEAAPGDASAPPRDATLKDTAESAAAVDAVAPRPDAARASDTDPSDTRDTRPPDADADANAVATANADADASTDAAPVPPPNPGDLRITELLINPAGTDTNREWIEVVNLASHAVDLHLLTVADAAGEVAVDAGVLGPGAIMVLGQSLDPARNGSAPIGFSFGNAISLNNGGDLIRLCLGPCAGGAVIAEVSWAADLGAAFDGHAAVVGIDVGPPDGGGSPDAGQAGDDGPPEAGAAGRTPVFCPADQPFGTAGSFGRPGLPDPPCPG